MTDIVVDKVSFRYRKRLILEEASFSTKKGEWLGIIGPNGGGKTTLLKLLMGFLTPEQGSVTLWGNSPDKIQHRIGYVPQALHFDRTFPISTLELVLQGRLSHLPWHGRFPSKDRQAALDALEQLNLVEYASHQFGSLSGGQRQRALIARAIVSDPELLLLDEPTANVDTEAEQQIYSLLNKWRGEKTILMVTHDLRSIVEQVDKVLCVEQKVTSIEPKKICEHFAIGLYHHPLIASECCLPNEKGNPPQ